MIDRAPKYELRESVLYEGSIYTISGIQVTDHEISYSLSGNYYWVLESALSPVDQDENLLFAYKDVNGWIHWREDTRPDLQKWERVPQYDIELEEL